MRRQKAFFRQQPKAHPRITPHRCAYRAFCRQTFGLHVVRNGRPAHRKRGQERTPALFSRAAASAQSCIRPNGRRPSSRLVDLHLDFPVGLFEFRNAALDILLDFLVGRSPLRFRNIAEFAETKRRSTRSVYRKSLSSIMTPRLNYYGIIIVELLRHNKNGGIMA